MTRDRLLWLKDDGIVGLAREVKFAAIEQHDHGRRKEPTFCVALYIGDGVSTRTREGSLESARASLEQVRTVLARSESQERDA